MLTACSFASIPRLSITSRVSIVVGIGPSPLNVNHFALFDRQVCREEVVLDSWECLHDVASFPTYAEMVNVLAVSNGCRALIEKEDVCSVLECPSKLSSVYGKAERVVAGPYEDLRVVLHR